VFFGFGRIPLAAAEAPFWNMPRRSNLRRARHGGGLRSAIHPTKVGKSNGEGTFAGMLGNDKVAPIPAIRRTRSSTIMSNWQPRAGMVVSTGERTFALVPKVYGHRLCQLVEQRLRFYEGEGGESLGEPAVDRREQRLRFGPAALAAPQPSETRSGPQFPELGLLVATGKSDRARARPLRPEP